MLFLHTFKGKAAKGGQSAGIKGLQSNGYYRQYIKDNQYNQNLVENLIGFS